MKQQQSPQRRFIFTRHLNGPFYLDHQKKRCDFNGIGGYGYVQNQAGRDLSLWRLTRGERKRRRIRLVKFSITSPVGQIQEKTKGEKREQREKGFE